MQIVQDLSLPGTSKLTKNTLSTTKKKKIVKNFGFDLTKNYPHLKNESCLEL